MINLVVNFLIFSFLIFWLIYTVGFVFVARGKTKLKDEDLLALSLSIGVVIFVIATIILGFFNLRNLIIPLILCLDIAAIYKFRIRLLSPWKIFIKDKLLFLLIFMGILMQGFINFPSGFLYKEGLLFWSSQGHDGLWHVSLMEEITKNFPPQNPIFSGEQLYNYHYLVDILMGEFYRNFQFLSALDLYFRFFPVVFSIMIGISVFAFVSRWQENKKIGYLALLFTYFTGSFGYIVTFAKNRNFFGGETVFWAAQINTILGNPPHAIAISLLVTFLLSFYFYLKERNIFWFLLSAVLAMMLSGFKVSAGIVLLSGLGAAAISEIIFSKRWHTLLLCVFLGLTNVITIKTVTRGAEGFLMFLPWWFIRTMVVVKLDWIDLEHRRQHYLAQGTWHAYLRVFQLESEAFLIFLFGNLGMRIVGFLEIGKKIILGKLSEFKNPLEVLLLVTMLTGFLIPLFFVQKGIIYNNIQFMQYFLLIFGFYGAISTYKLLLFIKNRYLQVLVIIFLIFLSIPTVIGNLVEFYSRPPLAKISLGELQALEYLKQNSNPFDKVLAAPFNKYLNSKYKLQPWPIYAWYSTPYIPAIAGRWTYLSAEEQALITGYPMEARLEKLKKFFEQSDFVQNRQFLKEENIAYLYINRDELEKPLDMGENNLKPFFENNEVMIFKVRK
ncbi:MAG: hypothetical protein US31_C0004G0050 [Berkelbacteria bacterium GW2011_GWA1_36_9]|uniref:Glycosyltransferase RgtA/B/C/D-like domain-containing protein n=1 Tax=Berkelbacteria bacterium GW2011_GWA1_36_9 TaxID=1618331 RepID=A0A0G0FHG4_9BACT|nr:MAG: hypothetical protein US31_C0004G0050 [Berkelbacteria bacterium GW2011_GWA1_36_9]